ncbi:hypothetical protein [Blastococcus deserti]|uniref:Tc toxin complex TcA C-terminal TcB-binding domain-containing protein n=1 Tax=Blastococcus deserti TaxID=2259033 RepID=A0ABW4X8S2_9ACTN
MDLKQLMGRVIDTLYDGLTGGSAELPLPDNVMLNWLMPGVPFDPSAFDFAIQGPFAGPSELTLDSFRELVEALMADDGDGQGMDRAQAVEQAKVLYQQNLLGSWEQWSRLVDFIPLGVPSAEGSRWSATRGQGKHKHVSVVFAQANQTLSHVYRDTLERCEVADEPLTEQQQKIVDRMRELLTENVEVEDFITGEKRVEPRESRAMIAYKEKRSAYDNAVTDYASRLARANNGTAADLIEWQRSGGIYRRRATDALRDWIATGYKNDIERAQATLSHILGGSMVQWKDNLLQILADIDNNTTGAFGYPFHPASVLPGGFARSTGWSHFSETDMQRRVSSSSTSRQGTASVGFTLGFFSFGGAGGGGVKEEEFSFQSESFGMEFDYTTVEIMRPAFNPNFFLSRGWRPRDSFIRDHGPLHSNGEQPPKGAMIGYPTKALFVRDLKIYSTDVARFMRSRETDVKGGATFAIGPIGVGGTYQQSSKQGQSNLTVHSDSIEVTGLQLVCFLSALFPYTANPSPDVKHWI